MRIIELIEDARETGDDVIDPKIIPVGSIGVVRGVIVPGSSIWVDFGRGVGTIAISERVVRDRDGAGQ